MHFPILFVRFLFHHLLFSLSRTLIPHTLLLLWLLLILIPQPLEVSCRFFFSYFLCLFPKSLAILNVCVITRLVLSQFYSLKIRRLSNVMLYSNVVLRIMKLHNLLKGRSGTTWKDWELGNTETQKKPSRRRRPFKKDDDDDDDDDMYMTYYVSIMALLGKLNRRRLDGSY